MGAKPQPKAAAVTKSGIRRPSARKGLGGRRCADKMWRCHRRSVRLNRCWCCGCWLGRRRVSGPPAAVGRHGGGGGEQLLRGADHHHRRPLHRADGKRRCLHGPERPGRRPRHGAIPGPLRARQGVPLGLGVVRRYICCRQYDRHRLRRAAGELHAPEVLWHDGRQYAQLHRQGRRLRPHVRRSRPCRRCARVELRAVHGARLHHHRGGVHAAGEHERFSAGVGRLDEGCQRQCLAVAVPWPHAVHHHAPSSSGAGLVQQPRGILPASLRHRQQELHAISGAPLWTGRSGIRNWRSGQQGDPRCVAAAEPNGGPARAGGVTAR
ncbi:unnamed protein product [Phaeothamnion confervicola]